jgi:F0F1-type ATP synthase assembly protein I
MTTAPTPGPDEPTKPTEPPKATEPTQPAQPAQPTELSAEDKAEQLRAFNTREQDSAWRAIAYLLTGPLIYGGLGALADHLLGTSWLVGAGIVGGMALSLYLIWFRYGTH